MIEKRDKTEVLGTFEAWVIRVGKSEFYLYDDTETPSGYARKMRRAALWTRKPRNTWSQERVVKVRVTVEECD